MIILFGDKPDDTLSSLRHVTFSKKVATAKAFEKQPPTSPATNFHSQRVYYHIMVWMGVANEMNQTEWGWKNESGELIPIMTN